jgi:hypothetical protein
MGQCAKAVRDGFVEPTIEKLDNLGPGCFVHVNDNGVCCWAELKSAECDKGYRAVLHPALSGDQRQAGTEVVVRREQITALGCDRYCVC